jgi:uncharacterized protein YqjF (DUF2071 family)
MQGVMKRPLPDLPYFSAFPEINLRLYVEAEGKPGVFFLSLDAANIVAVLAARAIYNLPYFHARMSLSGLPENARFLSTRRRSSIRFDATYRPVGSPYESRPGSLEHWLTERYCLYAPKRDGGISRVEVHHHPWPLQPAEAEIRTNGLFQPHGLETPGEPALLHFSRRIDVAIWPAAGLTA